MKVDRSIRQIFVYLSTKAKTQVHEGQPRKGSQIFIISSVGVLAKKREGGGNVTMSV
jgi:hypothetical protein